MTSREKVKQAINDLIKQGKSIEDIAVKDMYAMLPDEKQPTIRDILSKIKKGKISLLDEKRNHTSTNTCTDTSINTLTSESTDTCINSDKEFINFLSEHEETLKRLILNTEKDFSICSNSEFNKLLSEIEFKSGKELNTNFSYTISKELNQEFNETCKHLGVSQRKCLHVALHLFNSVMGKNQSL